jgi:tRNA A37 methylthiotransferase MiaB
LRCAFCKRRDKAAQPEDIIEEVKRNIHLGLRKLPCLGKTSMTTVSPAFFIAAAVSFIDLLKMIEKVNGIEEIDFLTRIKEHIRTTF